MQGKAERLTFPDVQTLLAGFFREKAALRARHEAAARLVEQYEANNAYQYIIAREDVQLAWLRTALEQMGVPVPSREPAPDVRAAPKGIDTLAALAAEDGDLAQAFVDRWRGVTDGLSHARHRRMLEVILGETLEHKRFFELALQRRSDLLGRRAAGASVGGRVLPSRWVD